MPSTHGRARRFLEAAACSVQAQAGPLGAALVGLLAFLAYMGPTALGPTSLHWLIEGDFSQHLLGWLFFRNESPGFPLGAIPGYVHPLGTTLGFTDSLPWVGVLLRPFSSLLPTDFQYIGPWLGLCFMLQGAMAAWAARRVGAPVPLQWLVGGVLVLSPALLARLSMAHEALCAHWMLVLLVGLNLVPLRGERDAKRALGVAVALCVLAAGVHPVMAAMVLPLTLALCLRTALERRLRLSWPALTAVAGLASVLVLFRAFGYFGTVESLGAASFGDYSADLATFFNPVGFRDLRWSRFLPGLPRQGGQYEGFAYLGLGGLFALCAALVLAGLQARAMVRWWRRLLPVGAVVLGLAFFSLSWRITWLGEPLANVSALYAPVRSVAEAFRSTGRFVWPLYYALLLGSLLALLRLPRPAAVTALLALTLTLQGLDVNLGGGFQAGEGGGWSSPPSPALQAAAQGRKHLVLYPPEIHDGSGRGCRAGPKDFHRWAYRAYRLGLTFNSGYVARLDDARAQAYCLGLDAGVQAGRLDPETVYLSIPERLGQFRAIPGARCAPEDGLWMCVLETARR